MEQRTETEWKSVLCPDGKERTWVMCEWDTISEGGRILKRILRQIDCFHPRLTEFDGADCNWFCEGIIAKGEIEGPSGHLNKRRI